MTTRNQDPSNLDKWLSQSTANTVDASLTTRETAQTEWHTVDLPPVNFTYQITPPHTVTRTDTAVRELIDHGMQRTLAIPTVNKTGPLSVLIAEDNDLIKQRIRGIGDKTKQALPTPDRCESHLLSIPGWTESINLDQDNFEVSYVADTTQMEITVFAAHAARTRTVPDTRYQLLVSPADSTEPDLRLRPRQTETLGFDPLTAFTLMDAVIEQYPVDQNTAFRTTTALEQLLAEPVMNARDHSPPQ